MQGKSKRGQGPQAHGLPAPGVGGGGGYLERFSDALPINFRRIFSFWGEDRRRHVLDQPVVGAAPVGARELRRVWK